MNNMKNIRLAKPHFTIHEVLEVLKTLDSGWVAQGPCVKKFEQEFAEYCGAKHAVAVNSCTSGLYLSLLLSGVKKGTNVIVPDFTFVATGNASKQTGAEVQIVDVDPDTYCIDVSEIEDKINPNTKAIIPVHALGHSANILDINKLAKEHGIKVVEDAASGIGSMIGRQKVGSFGNTSCFSLQGRKIITTGEGGVVTTNDDYEAKQLRFLRSHGAPVFQEYGFSLRLSDIQAGIGSVQLGRVESFITRRKYLASLYNDLIEDAQIDVLTPVCGLDIRHTYQAYVVLVKNRDNVVEKLRERGIEATIGTQSLSSMPLFRDDNICPVGKRLYKHSMAIPMYYELSHTDIEYVVDCLGDVVSS